MNVLHAVPSAGAAYFDRCACGGMVYVGTDGDGHIIEVCDAGCELRVVPRVPSASLEIAVINDPIIAQLRADAEAKRQKYRLCTNGCGVRVSRAQDDLCARCASDRRYANDVLRRAILKRERAS